LSQHKTVTKAAGFLVVAILASRLLGLVREMLIARQFGQSGLVSAYTSAFNLPDLLYFFLSSGALSSAFIPIFTERFRTGRQKEAWEIFSIIGCLIGLVLTSAIVLFWIFARPLVEILAVPGFVHDHPELIPITVKLTRIILPCQLFFFMGGLMMGTLESRQLFSARGLGPVLYNLGIIAGAVLLSKWFGIAGLAWGALAGCFAGNILYTFHCLRRAGFEFHPSLNFRHPGVVKVAQLALPVILGLSLPQIDIIINRWFASFVSESSPAALNYANRLMQVPLGIFAQAAGTALMPTLSAYAANKAIDDMRSGVSFGLRVVMVENIPATIFMIMRAGPLVRAVYMGDKFGPADVPETTVPFVFYCLGIFAWAGQAIVARGFFAMQDTLTPVLLGSVSAVIFIPLNYVLMRAMGTGGLALATTIAATLHFFGLTFFLRKRLDGIEGGRVLTSVLRVCVAALLMGIACWGTRLGMERSMGTVAVRPDSLMRPAAIASRLVAGSDPVSRQIGARYLDENERIATDHATVARVLNRAILGPSLYSERTFAGTNLSPKTRTLLRQQDLQGAALAGLNRRLLEDAFAGDIKRIGHTPSDSRKGSVLMVLVTMLVCLVVYVPMLKVLKVEEADFVWSALRRRLGRKGA